jgi:hypothetical protein
MFKRSELVVERPYFERKSGQYFWTPDGIGCFWYDSKKDLEAVLDFDGEVWQISELED